MPYLNKKIFTKPVFLAVMAGLALIAMPISSYSAVDMYLKIEGIEGESSSAKPSEMRATDETTVAAVIAYVARLAGTDRSKVSLTWKGRPLNAKKTLGSYHMKGRITIKAKIDKSTPLRGTSEKY